MQPMMNFSHAGSVLQTLYYAVAAGEAEADSGEEDSFLDITASVTEGPVALYRKGRHDGMYRMVSTREPSCCSVAVVGDL